MKPVILNTYSSGISERGVQTVGQERQSVRCITRNPAGHRLNILPLPLRRADLQPRHVLAEQQRQTTEVGVAAFRVRHCFVPFFLGADVVDHISTDHQPRYGFDGELGLP